MSPPNKNSTTYTITEAKANLSKLVQKALAGEQILLGSGRNPEVVIMRYEKPKPKRIPGALEGKGEFWISENFNDPCPEIEQLFYGNNDDEEL